MALLLDPSTWLQPALARHLALDAGSSPALRAALETAAAGCGSLTRARLCATTALVNGLDRQTAERLAVAVEYYHLASLILDDLPCMDDATLRRGRPCLHLRFGESTALLAALTLIHRAYRLIDEAIQERPLAQRQRAGVCVEQCLGARGILNGQALDLAFGRHARGDAHAVTRVALQKTAALLRLALLLPAEVAGVSPHEALLLRRLATLWGLLYQGLDDCKDLHPQCMESSKSSGRDQALGRPNLVHALGLDATLRRLSRLESRAERGYFALLDESPSWAYLRPFHLGLVESRRQLHLPCAAFSA